MTNKFQRTREKMRKSPEKARRAIAESIKAELKMDRGLTMEEYKERVHLMLTTEGALQGAINKAGESIGLSPSEMGMSATLMMTKIRGKGFRKELNRVTREVLSNERK